MEGNGHQLAVVVTLGKFHDAQQAQPGAWAARTATLHHPVDTGPPITFLMWPPIAAIRATLGLIRFDGHPRSGVQPREDVHHGEHGEEEASP
ncbi:hypothetical protein ACIP6P_31405, partial [Streptomyces sp. NPDC088729]|uniref:hypothetical protein n=1 Tax=Streptomyces sp. NPDC088729 TaxID=3365876 RepID=UPI0037F6F610